MSRNSLIILLFLSAPMIFATCEKEKAGSSELAPLSIEFDHVAGDKNLLLNNTTYQNAAGEKFTITLLQYFISNIQLQSTGGSWFTVPQDSSYFLIRESDPSTRNAKIKVPAGDYKQLRFVLGVDSLRSTMDISRRTGILDPADGHDGMYWGWNSGYIFFRFEGLSPAAPADPGGQQKFRYHIGGFGGYSAPTVNNIKTVTIDLTGAGIAKVQKGRESNIHLVADILQLFNGPTQVSIAANSTVMFSEFSKKVAENYAGMFRHDHTEN